MSDSKPNHYMERFCARLWHSQYFASTLYILLPIWSPFREIFVSWQLLWVSSNVCYLLQPQFAVQRLNSTCQVKLGPLPSREVQSQADAFCHNLGQRQSSWRDDDARRFDAVAALCSITGIPDNSSTCEVAMFVWHPACCRHPAAPCSRSASATFVM